MTRIAVAVVCAIVLALPIGVGALEVRVEVRPGGVVGLGPDGAERWTIVHPSLTEGRKANPPVGPAGVGGLMFYAVETDLLQLDVDQGRVVRRTRFPAAIVALVPATDDSRLLVTVTTPGPPLGQVQIGYRPGDPRPGRGAWTLVATGPAHADARQLVPGFDGVETRALLPGDRDAAIKAFERAEAVDLTNPYLPVFRGNLLAAAGRSGDAGHAYASAAGPGGAAWPDLLRVSAMLEDADARDDARRAFTRGLEGMRANGLRGEAVNSLITPLTLVGSPRRALKHAVEAGDVERMHELASRLFATFPHVENANEAASALATWMRSRGRQDLASTWSQRAAEGPNVIRRHFDAVLASADRVTPLAMAALLAPALLALVVGSRARVRRRLHLSDVVSVVIPLVVSVWLVGLLVGWVQVIGTLAGAPLPLLDDAVAAPEVEQWLTERPVGPARERLLAYVRREAQATREGSRHDQPPLDQTAFLELVQTVPLGTRLGKAFRESPWGPLAESGVPFPPFTFWWACAFALVLFMVGWLVARWRPAATIASWMIPGGPRSLGVLGGVVGGVFFAALFTVLGFERMLRSIAAPDFSGLLQLPTTAGPALAPPLIVRLLNPSRDSLPLHASFDATFWVSVVVLALCVIVQVWGIRRDRVLGRAETAHGTR